MSQKLYEIWEVIARIFVFLSLSLFWSRPLNAILTKSPTVSFNEGPLMWLRKVNMSGESRNHRKHKFSESDHTCFKAEAVEGASSLDVAAHYPRGSGGKLDQWGERCVWSDFNLSFHCEVSIIVRNSRSRNGSARFGASVQRCVKW